MESKITLSEQKNLELQMLHSIDDFCKKNHIIYYLSYGTLIGAVRHNGFIPWDDDIDIAMPRKDYDFFINNYSHDFYKVINANNTKNYYCLFTKLIDQRTKLVENGAKKKTEIGVYIDVFPLDNIPNKDDRVLNKLFFWRQLFRAKTLTSPSKNPSIIHKGAWSLLKLVSCFFSTQFLYNKIDRISSTYKDTETEFVGQITALIYGKKEILSREAFNNSLEMQFENQPFCAPANYDLILKNIYGEYMILPPPEKRVVNHNVKAYWRK